MALATIAEHPNQTSHGDGPTTWTGQVGSTDAGSHGFISADALSFDCSGRQSRLPWKVGFGLCRSIAEASARDAIAQGRSSWGHRKE